MLSLIVRAILALSLLVFLVGIFTKLMSNVYNHYWTLLKYHQGEPQLKRCRLLFWEYFPLGLITGAAIVFVDIGFLGVPSILTIYAYLFAAGAILFWARATSTTKLVKKPQREFFSKLTLHLIGFALLMTLVAIAKILISWVVSPAEFEQLFIFSEQLKISVLGVIGIGGAIFGVPIFFASIGELLIHGIGGGRVVTKRRKR